MAIAIHSVVTQTNFTGTATPTTISITPPGGGDVITVISIDVRENNTTTRQVSSVIFNGGENFTEAVTSSTGGSQVQSSKWYLVNPTATTADLVITMVGACEGLYFTIVHITGVDTVNPIDGTNNEYQLSDSSGTIGSTVTTANNNSILIDGLVIDNDDGHTMDVETGRVERLDTTHPFNSEAGSSTRTTTSAGVYAMAWTNPGGAESTAWSVVAIKEAAVASTRRIMIVN